MAQRPNYPIRTTNDQNTGQQSGAPNNNNNNNNQAQQPGQALYNHNMAQQPGPPPNPNNMIQQSGQPPYYNNMAQQPGHPPYYNNMPQQPGQSGPSTNYNMVQQSGQPPNYNLPQQPVQPPVYFPAGYQLQPPPPPPPNNNLISNPISNANRPSNPNTNIFPLGNRADSDGDASRWPINDPSYTRGDAADMARFCTNMSVAYSKPDFYTNPQTGTQYPLHNITFTDLPQGYALFWKPRPLNADGSIPVPARDIYVFGHKRGIIRSAEQFAKHVHAILNQSLNGCLCEKCNIG